MFVEHTASLGRSQTSVRCWGWTIETLYSARGFWLCIKERHVAGKEPSSMSVKRWAGISWPLLQLRNRISQFSQLRMRNLLHPGTERPRKAKLRSVSSSQPHFLTWQFEESHDMKLSNRLGIKPGEAGGTSCSPVHWRRSNKSIFVYVFSLKKNSYTNYTESTCSCSLLPI